MDWGVLSLFLLAALLAGKTVAAWAAHAAGLFSLGFSAVTAAAAWKMFRSGSKAQAGALPPMTVMKPLKGVDRELYENLASFCAQDYPVFQLVFCVSDASDPALKTVERLRRDFPACDIAQAVSRETIGCNPKISNLANAYPLAKHGLLVLSDSDIRVAPDFLRRNAAAFDDPKVGLASCFYRAAGGRGLWGSLEALSVNAHFMPKALAAAAFGMRFAMGAAIFVRRSAFESIGGFARLADHIADDFVLGRAILSAGCRIGFSTVVVDSITPAWTVSDFFKHQLRECRTLRICEPAGYAGSVLLHGFSLLTVKTVLFGADRWTLGLLGALLAVKAAATWAIHRTYEGTRESAAPLLLLPLSEWLGFGFWLSGLRAGKVLWRGVLYSVEADGRMTAPRPAA